jgi:hypothetical protein
MTPEQIDDMAMKIMGFSTVGSLPSVRQWNPRKNAVDALELLERMRLLKIRVLIQTNWEGYSIGAGLPGEELACVVLKPTVCEGLADVAWWLVENNKLSEV